MFRRFQIFSFVAVSLWGVAGLWAGSSLLGCAGTEDSTALGTPAPGGDGVGDGREEPSSPEPGGGAGSASLCTIDSDCSLAASTCCECPSFAVPAGQGFDSGCAAVDCTGGPTSLCPAIQARCMDGQCSASCSPILTSKVCEFGFVRDGAGCLLDKCAAADTTAGECTVDSDCVQIPNDCCGCARGGTDRAAPASDAQAIVDAQACGGTLLCPEIYVCDAEKVPRCVSKTCVLAPVSQPPALDPSAAILCGAPQYAACPASYSCLLNAFADASDLGVGSCEP